MADVNQPDAVDVIADLSNVSMSGLSPKSQTGWNREATLRLCVLEMKGFLFGEGVKCQA